MHQYLKIDGSRYRRIFIVGDIHGCYNRLWAELEEVGFDTDADLLVSVGDLIDRGAQSLECLDLMNAPWFRCVLGNHESMAVQALAGSLHAQRNWFANGGDWYWQLDPEQRLLADSLIRKAAALPLVIELAAETGLIVVCHADYPSDQYQFGKPLAEYDVVWSRQRYARACEGEHREISGATAFYFGHTPVMKRAQSANQHYIDTGAVFGHRLTLVQVQ